MLAGKLGDVALQMLRTDLVERPFVRPLEHGPEALDAVGMRDAVNVFANRMLDRFVVVGDAPISRRFIGVDRGIGGCVIGDEALQRLCVRSPSPPWRSRRWWRDPSRPQPPSCQPRHDP